MKFFLQSRILNQVSTLPWFNFLQIFLSVILAVAMLYFVGFSEINALHNSAHDARHVFVFPCH